MAEETPETQEGATEGQGSVETVEPLVEPEAIEELGGDEAGTTESLPDKEPGGSDGESVYQRKLYRENKRLQEQNQQAQIEQARLSERLRLVEEQAARKPEPTTQKVYTVAEIEEAVDAGSITRADAERYKFEVIVPQQTRRAQEAVDKERSQRESQQRPRIKAASEIQQYVAVAPYLTDDKDPRTIEIGQRALELQQDYGISNSADPQSLVVKALAIKQSLGPLEALKKKGEVRNLTRNGTSTHAESGNGGTGNEKSGGDALKKVSPEMIAEWKRQEPGITDERLKKFAQHQVNKMAGRSARFGR